MEWKEVRLGDIADVQTGPFGSQLHKSDYIAEGIPCIMPTNIGPHLNLVVDGIAHVSEVDANRLSRHLTEFGDIIYARRGDIEKCAYVTTNEEKWLCGTGCLKIRCKNEVNSRFIAYLLSTAECKKWITGNAVGTTMLNLSKGILSNLPLIIPSLVDQRRIASVLSSLDRKIELNNKINVDLEEMAQAIFKNWFVDFEPFKDGKFVDSELGMIPEGWKVGGLFDIAEIFDKKRKPLSGNVREKMDKIYPYYGATSCMDYVDDYIFDGIYTLIGEDGSVVKENGLPYMQYVWGKMWVNNHAHILQGKNGYSTEMIHALLSITNIKFLVTGAVQAKLSQGNMQKILVAIPPKNVLDEIRPVIDNLYSKIRSLSDENSRLSLLRNTLLPRLMSGELEVPE